MDYLIQSFLVNKGSDWRGKSNNDLGVGLSLSLLTKPRGITLTVEVIFL